jgi:hypothetical protein
LLTAVTFFQNAPFFTNKILFFKNLILKIKYIKIKKKKRKKRKKKEGWPNHPHVGGWPPLGGCQPPPMGWFGHPSFFFFFFFS